MFRGIPVQAFKNLDKVVDIGISAACGNRVDRQGSGIEQDQCMADTDAVDIIRDVCVCLLFKQRGQVGFCDVAHIRKKAQRQWFCIVEIDIGDAALGKLGIIFHGVISHQQAVFAHNGRREGVQVLAAGAGAF